MLFHMGVSGVRKDRPSGAWTAPFEIMDRDGTYINAYRKPSVLPT